MQNKTAKHSKKAAETSDIDALYSQVYTELRDIAQKQLGRAWSVETISTTALVNEAYIKLAHLEQSKIENQAHFFAIAATAMRQILINYAEKKSSQKRGGDWLKVTYQEPGIAPEAEVKSLLAVNDALDEIRLVDPNLAQLVELRFFAGMNETEIAKVFDINERTVRRNWRKAKMLLKQALDTGE